MQKPSLFFKLCLSNIANVRGNSFKPLTYLKTTIVMTNKNKCIYLHKEITEGGSVFNKNI